MLLIIEALLLILAALGQDHRAAAAAAAAAAAVEGKIYPLDMALDSVDDQYMGCRDAMAKWVETELLKNDLNNLNILKTAWEKAEKTVKIQKKEYSKLPREKEVLIPPYEKFKVTAVMTRSEQKDLWCETVFTLKSSGTRSDLNCALFKKPSKTKTKLYALNNVL
ncbi:unnamed protein product [Leuciscus chuanchicus]